MKLYTFYQLFKFVRIDQIEALRRVKIGQFTINPGGRLDRGIVIAGINPFDYVGDHWDCTVMKDGTYKVKRIYLHENHRI